MASALRDTDHRGLIAKVLASIRRTGPGDPGMTAQEIADKTGEDIKFVRRWIKAEQAAGRVALGWRPAKGIDGRKIDVPVYRSVP
jgi:hypothetical protein